MFLLWWPQEALFATLVLVVNLAFLRNHLNKYGALLNEYWVELWKKGEKLLFNKFPEKRSRNRKAVEVESALWDVRARTYRHATELFIHLSTLVILGMSYNLYIERSLTQTFQLCVMLGVYKLHSLVCSDKFILDASKLRSLYSLFYVSFVAFVLAEAWQEDKGDGSAVYKQIFNAGSRMVMPVIFIDTLVALPAQLAISMAEILQNWMQHGNAETGFFAAVQILTAIGIICVSAILEYFVTCHVSTLLDTESVLSSSRRLLRGVCDGEVLLAEDMRILGLRTAKFFFCRIGIFFKIFFQVS